MRVEELNQSIKQHIKTDEVGRIFLTDRMKDALNNAEQSYSEGSCLNIIGFLYVFNQIPQVCSCC